MACGHNKSWSSLGKDKGLRLVLKVVVVKIWPSQDRDTYPSNQKPLSLRSHSKNCSSPRGRFRPDSSDALNHLGAPPSGDFSSAQDNHGNRSSQFLPSVTQFDLLPCFITWNALLLGQLGTEVGFSVCNPNNQAPTITTVTSKLHVQIKQLRRSRSYHPLLYTQIMSSINGPSPPARKEDPFS